MVLGILLLFGALLMSGCIGPGCTDECTESKCEGSVYYECVNHADGCNDLVNRGEVEGECDYALPVCNEYDTKCIGTTYFECSKNQWQNMGKVEGECDYSKCKKPYINVGDDCCLDENDNGRCDKDEVKCGDGRCDSGETQDTCCKDCGCPSDYYCKDDKCEKIEPKITLELKGRTASGKVSGMDPSEYDNYWVVVYVETDILYVQPVIKPSSARYIEIKSNGYWSVSGLHIGYGGKVRAFLIGRGFTAPGTLPIGKKPSGVVAETMKSTR